MYEDAENPVAIYNNEKALGFFSSQISKSISNGVKILVADNANCGSCSAGLHSIGILCDGDVVPCLSMRSWVDINSVVVGNILGEDWQEPGSPLDESAFKQYKENPLKYIWEKRFDKYRFESFKCCKDHCKNKCVEIKIIDKTTVPTKTVEDLWEKNEPKIPDSFPKVVLYGVFPGTVRVYGVVQPERTYVYACPGNWQDNSSIYAVNMSPPTCNDVNDVNIDKTTTDYDDTKDKDKDKDKDND